MLRKKLTERLSDRLALLSCFFSYLNQTLPRADRRCWRLVGPHSSLSQELGGISSLFLSLHLPLSIGNWIFICFGISTAASLEVVDSSSSLDSLSDFCLFWASFSVHLTFVCLFFSHLLLKSFSLQLKEKWHGQRQCSPSAHWLGYWSISMSIYIRCRLCALWWYWSSALCCTVHSQCLMLICYEAQLPNYHQCCHLNATSANMIALLSAGLSNRAHTWFFTDGAAFRLDDDALFNALSHTCAQLTFTFRG